MAAVAGLRGTGDWGTDERPKNFRELIMFRNPNGSAPLFALTARIASESVNDPEFSWWDEPNDLIRLQVDAAFNSTVTAFTVELNAAALAAVRLRTKLAGAQEPAQMPLLTQQTVGEMPLAPANPAQPAPPQPQQQFTPAQAGGASVPVVPTDPNIGNIFTELAMDPNW